MWLGITASTPAHKPPQQRQILGMLPVIRHLHSHFAHLLHGQAQAGICLSMKTALTGLIYAIASGVIFAPTSLKSSSAASCSKASNAAASAIPAALLSHFLFAMIHFFRHLRRKFAASLPASYRATGSLWTPIIYRRHQRSIITTSSWPLTTDSTQFF
jgi:hypothetical protein